VRNPELIRDRSLGESTITKQLKAMAVHIPTLPSTPDAVAGRRIHYRLAIA
jgi:hypothetical protein